MCVKVVSSAAFGSTVVGFTTNTRNMTLPGHPGVTFRATPGMTPTIIEQSLGEPTNLELSGIYTSNTFTQTDVIAGKWASAVIEVFSVCWDNVNLGELLHFKGHLAQFKDNHNSFTCEARGLTAKLSQDVNFATSRLCRKTFRSTGAGGCNHTASTVVISGTTYNITQTNKPVELDASPSTVFLHFLTSTFTGSVPPNNFYANGKITATSGANNGVSREMASSSTIGGTMYIQLKRSFPFNIEAGDTFTLIAGCDKTLEACIKFGNVVNRGAEDYIPGLESINRLPQV
jgi:uncharacterized phage protein (TIGR02218 family)